MQHDATRVMQRYIKGMWYEMTLTEMAKRLDTSTMTIYRRLKAAGMDIRELRDDKNQLTPAGMSVIASMFDGAAGQKQDINGTIPAQQNATDDATRAQQAGGSVVTSYPATAADVLQAKLDGANALIEQLTGERDELRRQLDAALAALAAEQADRANERRLLTGSDPQRGHWWSFFRKRV